MSSRSQAENVCFSAYLDSLEPDKCAHGGRELQYLIEANILLKGYKLGGCHAPLGGDHADCLLHHHLPRPLSGVQPLEESILAYLNLVK